MKKGSWALFFSFKSNNETFMRHLAKYCRKKGLSAITYPDSKIICFAHVINLAVQEFLKYNTRIDVHDEEEGSDDNYDYEDPLPLSQISVAKMVSSSFRPVLS